MPHIKEVPVDLIDDGLLWLINKAAFHPRGFALAYDTDTKEFILWGNGDEPWAFTEEVDNEKFKAVEAALRRVRA